MSSETESCRPSNWSRMQGRVTGAVPGLFNSSHNSMRQRIPVAVLTEAQVCGRSLVGIEGSDPAQGMDICLL